MNIYYLKKTRKKSSKSTLSLNEEKTRLDSQHHLGFSLVLPHYMSNVEIRFDIYMSGILHTVWKLIWYMYVDGAGVLCDRD